MKKIYNHYKFKALRLLAILGLTFPLRYSLSSNVGMLIVIFSAMEFVGDEPILDHDMCLFSGLAGAGDNRQLNVLVGSEEEEAMAYDRNYRRASLSHTFKLQDFDIATNAADGSPTQYSARILIDNNPVDIAVNSPHALSLCEDIYLMNFKSTQEDGKVNLCVLTIERQPWKYPMLIGLVMLLIGTAARGGKIERLKN